jgi:hypothetical protein
VVRDADRAGEKGRHDENPPAGQWDQMTAGDGRVTA